MSNKLRGERLIFVAGAPRSGTTLLQNMLNSHQDILGGPEFTRIPDIIILRRKLYNSIKNGRINLFCNYQDVDEYICSLIESLLLPLADKHGCKFLSEKTPQNLLVFPELISLFPGSHFINVVRDPRAVIASNLNLYKKFIKKGIKREYNNGRSVDFMDILNKRVKAYHLAGISASKIAPGKVLTVVYERLVNNPESETKKICKFLGIEWTAQIIHPSRYKHLGEETMTRQEGAWYTSENYNRDPETTEINKWENQLTSLQKAITAICFRDIKELAKYGYHFNGNSLSQKLLIVLFQISKKLLITRVLRKFLKATF